jgi:competence protein ComEA
VEPPAPAPPAPFGGTGPSSTPEITPPGFSDAPPAPKQSPAESTPPDFGATAAPPEAASSGRQINLNSVTFEQLRAENLSVTQATRLLAHRERLGGFSSIDDLDQVAGFPDDVLADLKSRATI